MWPIIGLNRCRAAHWTTAEKVRLVKESMQAGMSVSCGTPGGAFRSAVSGQPITSGLKFQGMSIS
ncbi:hypothetical protein, partial [Mesorhizobium sp.]|uniref:hypothetical protein n=1 Tax=Mesorhizobium sp. TaxID=1871066 RepID=UPI0025B85D4B